MVKVKVCGITNYQDASMAIELGADALGFIFASSPRQITPEKARDIIYAIPPFVQTVGVFVDEDPGKIRRTIHLCGLDLVQLHGDESPDLCRELMPCAIKALRLKDESSLSAIKPYRGRVRAILLDTYMQGKRGGTGRTFDWDLAIKAKEFGIPTILSGGLNPDTISEAISLVKPFGVDVNSGIEESPGKKSPNLMGELMEIIRKMES
ncbi:MAG: phosphoribosylanthranilate isomerase [Desulfatiglandales bacterium]